MRKWADCQDRTPAGKLFFIQLTPLTTISAGRTLRENQHMHDACNLSLAGVTLPLPF